MISGSRRADGVSELIDVAAIREHFRVIERCSPSIERVEKIDGNVAGEQGIQPAGGFVFDIQDHESRAANLDLEQGKQGRQHHVDERGFAGAGQAENDGRLGKGFQWESNVSESHRQGIADLAH